MATATRANKEIVQRGFDALNERDRTAFRELHAEDAVIHVMGEEIHGIDAIVANQFGLFEAFSDLTYTPEVIVAEDDTVAARWTATGTHDGPLEDIEPTGRSVAFPVMGTFTVERGQLVDVRIQVDRLDLLQQLGALEAPMA